MQQTSLEAYDLAKFNINKSQMSILLVLRGFNTPLTNAEMAKELRWSINRVTPRVLELRKGGILMDRGIRKCSVTLNNAHQWGLNDG